MPSHTIIAAASATTSLSLGARLPTSLPPAFASSIPKLSLAQAGHLRHFHNLSSLPAGDWDHMGAQDPGQEWDTAYRYQIATMAYAAAAAHFHRMKPMRERAIDQQDAAAGGVGVLVLNQSKWHKGGSRLEGTSEAMG